MITAKTADYILLTCLVSYLIVLLVYWARHDRLKASGWVLACLLLWPLLLADEWFRVFATGDEWVNLSASTDFIPVLLLTCLYKAIKPQLVAGPIKPRPLIWAPALVCFAAQWPVILTPAAQKQAWLTASPVGEPLLYWALYSEFMLTGFGVLLLAILTTETIQNYHRHLREQVVDVQQYKAAGLGGLLGMLVGVAFVSILLVTAVTFGFLQIPFWQSLFHWMFALSLLIALVVVLQPRNTSPSPLDYPRLQELHASQSAMQHALSKADKAVLEHKAYKKVGITLRQFAKTADVDPTTLAIALRLVRQQDFRQYMIQYRLDYAKQILLRSDANVTRVARRLGLNSDKFIGELLVDHIRKPG